MPFVDISYQGICSGSFDKDAFIIRELAKQDVEMLIAQSFSKTMSLYGERTGTLTFTSSNQEALKKMVSQLEVMIRSSYSNPPLHGSMIASSILTNPVTKAIWQNDVKEMYDRIRLMRTMLVANLKREGSTRNWDFLTENKGMFSFLGITENQVKIFYVISILLYISFILNNKVFLLIYV